MVMMSMLMVIMSEYAHHEHALRELLYELLVLLYELNEPTAS